eukprot:2951780-Pleurochrysis_carterae.AAC.1
MGYEWTEEEEDAFEVEAIVGKIVADGRTAFANQGKAAVGIVLYGIVWRDYPPDIVWYEPGENLGSELLQHYKQSLAEKAAAEGASAREDAEIIDLKMPVVEHSRVSSD